MPGTVTASLAVADLFAVDGLVAVVTGGATGIGLMIVKALEENGAKVYIVGRRKEVLDKVAREEAKHGNIIPMQGDASSKEDLERIVKHITEETGYINLLVANAGISGPTPIKQTPDRSLSDIQKDMWNLDPAMFDKTFNNNVGSVYFATAAFLPLLEAGNAKGNVSQSSHVIITSSIGAFGRVPLAHYAYSASKAGVTHMAKQLSTAFTRHQIRFNVIAPGLYPSEMTAGIVKASDQLPPEDYLAKVSPLGRPGNTEDMAGCVLWLASKAGAWLSGVIVVTDGGKLGLVPSTY
ncbi:short-chain dehydrogenase/reductase [Corynespora cassiicola Philippines]|uniref:Short-chain dehydrogenase/reductase n=1 Tax=Corynespora cassiicola Philippines TaxID=1448308 RepID=A0A2T2NSH6_CORCC|nr:short-chain dehydrogenase/reductase [Corynespora cassiicola Philippines]